MQKITVILSVVLTLSLAATAQAESVTEAQIAEVRQLFDRVELEALLEKKRSEVTDLQPEGCAQVEVDYDLALADMPKRYDFMGWDSRDGKFQTITPRGKGKVAKVGCWFKFDNGVFPEVVRERIEASGDFLVADLWELNAFGTANPDLQRKLPHLQRKLLPLVALGSVWRHTDGNLSAPILSEDPRGRGLSPVSFDVDWYPHFRFLAVRK